jgi:folate-dependent phosphoribosylglycinamide formyltransferase PurN
MGGNSPLLERQISGVVFSGGPVLERGVKQFLVRLEEHPEIELLACICQSRGQSFQAVVEDLWQRRGLLAIPLYLIQTVNRLWRYLAYFKTEQELIKKLRKLADRIHYVTDIHAKHVLDQVQKLAPDIGLIYGSPILKPELFEIPRFGTLGIHHGKVPEYRGKKTTFWAIFNGERTAGVTIQKVNAGLDTGEIVRSGEVPIDNRTYGAVWNDLNDLGLDLYIEAILEVKKGTAEYQLQNGKKGKLFRDPKIGDILRLWIRQITGINNWMSTQ